MGNNTGELAENSFNEQEELWIIHLIWHWCDLAGTFIAYVCADLIPNNLLVY